MKYSIQTTTVFDEWATDIKDRQAALANGNFGDVKSVGDGVSEMRIFVGKGYRLYFTMRGGELVILLCGGDKSSQQRDIQKAKELAKNL
jgi:putative addiction module killer protein